MIVLLLLSAMTLMATLVMLIINSWCEREWQSMLHCATRTTMPTTTINCWSAELVSCQFKCIQSVSICQLRRRVRSSFLDKGQLNRVQPLQLSIVKLSIADCLLCSPPPLYGNGRPQIKDEKYKECYCWLLQNFTPSTCREFDTQFEMVDTST